MRLTSKASKHGKVNHGSVKKAAERMGGTVGFESEVDTGSRFWVQLRKVTQELDSGSVQAKGRAAVEVASGK